VTLQSGGRRGGGVSNGGNEKPPHNWKTIAEHPKKIL